MARVDARLKLSETAKIACMLNLAVRDLIFQKEEVIETLDKHVKSVDLTSTEIHNEEGDNAVTAVPVTPDPSSASEEPASKMLKLLQSLKSSNNSDYCLAYKEELARYSAHFPSTRYSSQVKTSKKMHSSFGKGITITIPELHI